jgi:DNA-binding transcriptional LysR family regulator
MSKPDLNLMVIFDAIMQEQSVTIAAQRLSMTQPSVSNALTRMRHVFKDPLFIKEGRGIKPTPFASSMWLQVSSSLNTISDVVSPKKFVPYYAKRTFRIALTDGLVSLLWLELRKVIEQTAPHINIHAVPYTMNGESLLMNAQVDLIADYVPDLGCYIQRQHLCNNYFVALMSPEHPLVDQEFDIKALINSDNLLVSLSGDASGIVDAKLAEQNLTRRIAMTTNSFASAMSLIKQTSLICVLPYAIAFEQVKSGSLVAKTMPIDIPPAEISMAWHNRSNRDVGLIWLRETIAQIVQNKQALFKSDAWVL